MTVTQTTSKQRVAIAHPISEGHTMATRTIDEVLSDYVAMKAKREDKRPPVSTYFTLSAVSRTAEALVQRLRKLKSAEDQRKLAEGWEPLIEQAWAIFEQMEQMYYDRISEPQD